ncbi:MAG: rhodanese-like domain-containing protein [Planctomycetota bacterium]|nr:rhodanese-like domain-containing protein [Planctomycetota bacterium]MCX8040804.1 rhodanese-like domain-containing protein [Planctomycetota bacterium]MDW8372255.1 rhodanese-like domain-containing protein [Planctomycetota bacterium]
MIASITPLELRARQLAGPVTIIDVRTPSEYAAGHIPGAINLPLDRLSCDQVPKADTIYVVCQGGVRSRKACEQLVAGGLAGVTDVLGGTNAWRNAGLPLEGDGRAVFGVERQVRCVVGLGVLAGSALAAFVHPWWAGLSAFFGAGLVFAGLTNLCPLANLLAAMPWNRSGSAPAAPSGSAASCCGGR